MMIAFAEFMDTRFPDATRSLTLTEGVNVLSALTGVAQHHVVAALELEPSFFLSNSVRGTTSGISTTALCCWLRLLADPTDKAESWWDAPDVYVRGAATEDGEGNGKAADRASHNTAGVKGVFQPARSAQPPQPASSSQRSGDHCCREVSMQPTRNSGSWREVSDGRPSSVTTEMPRAAATNIIATNCVTPVPSRQVSQGTAPSMEQVVAGAISELDVLADVLSHTDRCTADVAQVKEIRETARRCEDIVLHEDRARSPLPVQPRVYYVAAEAKRQQQLPPLPPSTTLAELESYVHRGKRTKVCLQFIRTGTCSYGARCLFHHPDPCAVFQTSRHHNFAFPSA
ncbi:hypothetical protein ABL78_5864 [Leptomonas seymouri]|uniref:C3H1-type domain-containing protein n=1 Tax=Leptomonas seymouri TaxID=5684 RepID=A0A0N1PD74_LEPSE|nr:hypothetical protein ABL78_5864 [Leptomonas seymouri]|eukprot:KPI85098.1 hypothetical protein ABL78_5864 [Leptomonas seymouri]